MEIGDPSTKDTLWHTMRADFERLYPETRTNDLLMCCVCGRLLPFEDFTIEHIIPRQMLQDDPQQVKDNPKTTKSIRGGLTLLCNAPLRVKDGQPRRLGCNGWKGRFYDPALREILNGTVINHPFKKVTTLHQIALLCGAYLAMVRRYGYQIALTPSGVLMRHQFFRPGTFVKDMPHRSQLILAGQAPEYADEHLDFWEEPFTFAIEPGSCLVRFRSIVMYVPMSRDPTTPISTHLRFVPSKYRLRPDFGVAFG